MLLSTLITTSLLTLLVAAVPAEEKRPTKQPTTTTKPPVATTVPTSSTSTDFSSSSTTITLPSPATPEPTPTHTYQSCGGFRIQQKPCPEGQICIDDPYRGGCGMACDAPGICVTPTFCGGFAGLACKDKGKKCVDDPRDDCDPKEGGADCGGICV